MPHPEVVDVLLTALAAQPRLSETAKGVKAHALFVELHCLQARGQPSFVQAMVHMRSAFPGPEQQAILAIDERLQESRDICGKIDLAGSRISLRILDDSRLSSVDLLTDLNGATVVNEMLGLQSKRASEIRMPVAASKTYNTCSSSSESTIGKYFLMRFFANRLSPSLVVSRGALRCPNGQPVCKS